MSNETVRKLLLVDDDDEFRENLKGTLESLGYQVTAVNNGRLAQSLLSATDTDAVITDIRMPEVNGIQLLHFIKRLAFKVPVILMTGYPEFEDPKEAIEIGASYYLSKPFTQYEIRKALAVCFKEPEPKPEPESSSSDDSKKEEFHESMFCKIDINDFIHGSDLRYDIFIRLFEKKFIKIANRGESLSADRISTYKRKNVKYLYMKRDDFKTYVGFNASLAKIAGISRNVDKARKLQVIKHANDVVMTQVFVDGVNEASYENATTIVESTASLLTDSNELLDLVALLGQHSNYLLAHSLGVSVHSTMIAKKMGWQSPLVLFRLSMGGLLHDIGKKEIPEEILTKPRALLTPAEQKIFESHTMRGAEILNTLPNIPTDVIQIAAQHHENCLGLGYPVGMKGKLIHPLARVVSVANEFCDLAIKNPRTATLPPKEAVYKLATTMGEALDPTALAALAQIYSVDLPTSTNDRKKNRFDNI